MKKLTFISTANGNSDNELAFLYETKSGIVLANIGIDHYGPRRNNFFKLIEKHIISFVQGDRELIEVTPEAIDLLKKNGFNISNVRYDLFLFQRKLNSGKGTYYSFATEEELANKF
jgi:hypothetical protein